MKRSIVVLPKVHGKLVIGGTQFGVDFSEWKYLPEHSYLFQTLFTVKGEGKIKYDPKNRVILFEYCPFFDGDPLYFRTILRYLKTGRGNL